MDSKTSRDTDARGSMRFQFSHAECRCGSNCNKQNVWMIRSAHHTPLTSTPSFVHYCESKKKYDEWEERILHGDDECHDAHKWRHKKKKNGVLDFEVKLHSSQWEVTTVRHPVKPEQEHDIGDWVQMKNQPWRTCSQWCLLAHWLLIRSTSLKSCCDNGGWIFFLFSAKIDVHSVRKYRIIYYLMYFAYLLSVLCAPVFVFDWIAKPHERKVNSRCWFRFVLHVVRRTAVRHPKSMSKYFKIINGTRDSNERILFFHWAAGIQNMVCIVCNSHESTTRRTKWQMVSMKVWWCRASVRKFILLNANILGHLVYIVLLHGNRPIDVKRDTRKKRRRETVHFPVWRE